jgi:hypothetical protein
MQVQREKDNAIKTRSPLFGIGQIRMSCLWATHAIRLAVVYGPLNAWEAWIEGHGPSLGLDISMLIFSRQASLNCKLSRNLSCIALFLCRQKSRPPPGPPSIQGCALPQRLRLIAGRRRRSLPLASRAADLEPYRNARWGPCLRRPPASPEGWRAKAGAALRG